MAEGNSIIFADGQMIENMRELINIAADNHMRIIINEDKAVLVRVCSQDEKNSEKDTGGK